METQCTWIHTVQLRSLFKSISEDYNPTETASGCSSLTSKNVSFVFFRPCILNEENNLYWRRFSLLVSYAKAYDSAKRSRSIPREPDDVIDSVDLFDLARFFTSSSAKYNNNKQYIFSSFDLLHYSCIAFKFVFSNHCWFNTVQSLPAPRSCFLKT